MMIVVGQSILVLLFTCVGYALVKTKLVDPKHTKVLSTLAVYVFLSATVFRTFANNFTINYLKEKYMLVLISAVILIVLIAVMRPLSKLLTKEPYKRDVLSYCMTVPNYGYVGYAMAEGIFGGLMLQNVMMVTMPIAMYAYTFGYCMLSRTKVSFKKLINPVNIAMVAGAIVGISGFRLSDVPVLEQFLSKAAACMAPTGMILVGMVTAEYPAGQLLKRKDVYLVTALRLLVVPLIIGAVLKLLNIDLQLIIPIMLVMAMPTSANAIIFPKLAGEDCHTGASLALVSNIVCCATVPFIFWIFGLMPA